MLYEIINPSDPVTLEAGDERLAAIAVILLGSGKFGLEDETGRRVLPIMFFVTGEEQVNKIMKEAIGLTLSEMNDYVESRRIELAEVFESALVGKISDRRSLIEAMKAGGGDLGAAMKKWNEERASSLSDICGASHRFGAALRKRDVEAKAG